MLADNLLNSWKTYQGINETADIMHWIKCLNENTYVSIKKISLSECKPWFYDEQNGIIRNENNSFFQVGGFRSNDGDSCIGQPIIIQDEIGYLGILCKEFDGVLHFLMQAKIEPGNVNKIQISPTIQATKSNFTQKHGGKKPAYLDYFINAEKYTIIVDQIQSEQSSRFLKKRNRNIIVKLPQSEDIEIFPNYKWITLGQIKELLAIDNLVNMDTRTVLSCIPFSQFISHDEYERYFTDKYLFNSIFKETEDNKLVPAYRYINNYKMFSERKDLVVPLFSLSNWKMKKNDFACKTPYHFKVVFCDISIDGREVINWTQPLFEAVGMALFGMFTTVIENRRMFLVKAVPEVGCFDLIEIGPSVQLEAGYERESLSGIEKLLLSKYEKEENVLYNVVLSEEGGRFFHEQNLNVIIEIEPEEIKLSEGYFWMDFRTLNKLTQINNCLNIQLRNLLSLLKI